MKNIFAVLMLLSSATLPALERSMTGKAYDLKTGQLIYIEKHKAVIEDGKPVELVVDYYDPSGNKIVTRTVNFRRSATLPDFTLNDLRTGFETGGVLVVADLIKLYRKRPTETERAQKDVRLPGLSVADAGFHMFILENWNRLNSGEELEVRFALSARLTALKFIISKDDPDNQRPDRVRFRFEVKNALYRVFVDPIFVTYDKTNKRLLEYIGISNIADIRKNENYKARIVFEY